MCNFPDKLPHLAYKRGCRCPRCVEHMKVFYREKIKKRRQDPKYREWEREYDRKRSKTPRKKAQNKERRAHARLGYKLNSPEEKNKIYNIYKESMELTESSGITHHVDHIIPLAYGGLHIPGNLQILTQEENLKKSLSVDGVDPEKLRTALTHVVDRYGEVLRRLSDFDKKI